MQVFCPSPAKCTARLVAIVLLPQPPLAFSTMIWRMFFRPIFIAGKAKSPPWFAQPPLARRAAAALAATMHIGYAASMRIEFWKMQGLGNDFLVFDAPPEFADRPADAHRLRRPPERHTGVGFDQALMLEAPRDDSSSVYYRIFNADGGEVEQCGNGARCIAALMHARHPGQGSEIRMASPGGAVRARMLADGRVSVDMGVPNFDPRALPMDADAELPHYPLQVDGREYR